MRAIGAFKASLCWHLSFTSSDRNSFAVDQRVRDLLASRLDDPSKGLARYTHFLSGFFLILRLVVGQANGLKFIQRNLHYLESAQGYTAWLEISNTGVTRDKTTSLWTWHIFIFSLTYYEHMPIISQVKNEFCVDFKTTRRFFGFEQRFF